MSLEDLGSDVPSDCSDHEAQQSPTGEEVRYQELVHLHRNLTRFAHIYINNAIIDMQTEEGEYWSSADPTLSHTPTWGSDDEDSAQSSFQDLVQLHFAVFSESPSSSADSDVSREEEAEDRSDAERS